MVDAGHTPCLRFFSQRTILIGRMLNMCMVVEAAFDMVTRAAFAKESKRLDPLDQTGEMAHRPITGWTCSVVSLFTKRKAILMDSGFKGLPPVVSGICVTPLLMERGQNCTSLRATTFGRHTLKLS